MELKIRPTVYVGLGTTGMEILNHLRQLNHLEYGQAGLPIFRYVSIETDASKSGRIPMIDADERVRGKLDEEGVPILETGLPPNAYEVNEVIHTTLSHPEPIRDKINPANRPIFNADMASWLDETILDAPAVNGGAGAGNLRMAGRLALWENWNKGSYVRLSLHAAYNTVRRQAHRQKAESILTTHFDQKIEVDSERCNIFIVGTLCGGTCSGMLLDIAYYFRYIGKEYAKIYGIFTMPNAGLALGGDAKILLANCWASLVEQDFYQRPGTEYWLTLPDGAEIRERRAPFDVASFLCPMNMKGHALVDASGKFVTGQLDQMVATDLFLRSLGVDSLIETDLVNADLRDSRFKKVRDVGDADKTAFVQSMFSSGVDIGGVWLPKNALVSSAVGIFIKILQENWSAGTPASGSPEADKFVPTEEDIKRALQIEAFGTKLQDEIDAINADNFSTAASACLSALLARPGEKYYDESEANRAAYSQQYRERLNQVVESFKGHSQLCPKQNFLSEVEASIRAKLEKVEASILAELEKSDDDFSENRSESEGEIAKIVAKSAAEIGTIVSEAEEDSTTKRNTNVVISVVDKLLGREQPEEFKLSRFKARISAEQKRFRNKFMDLGIGKILVRETLRNLLSETEELRRKVDKEIDDIDKRFETSVIFLSGDDPTDHIVRAAAHLAALAYEHGFSKEEDREVRDEELIRLMRRAEPDAFRWHIQEKLRKAFHRFVPALIGNIRFDKGAGKRSSPYQEFTPFYDNYKLNFDEKGGNTRLFRYLLAEEGVAGTIGDLKLTQAESKKVLVPNLRALYQMEAGYTPDDILVARQLKKAYDAAHQKFKLGTGDPVHIHKNPDMFDMQPIRLAKEMVKRTELVKREWRVLRELLPRIREVDANRFQSVFPNGDFNGTGSLNGDRTLDPGELTIKVVGKSGIQITFPDNEAGWEKLAADAEASNNFIEAIRSELGNMLDGFPPDLIELIDDLNGLVGKEESEEFYADYVNLLRGHVETPQN